MWRKKRLSIKVAATAEVGAIIEAGLIHELAIVRLFGGFGSGQQPAFRSGGNCLRSTYTTVAFSLPAGAETRRAASYGKETRHQRATATAATHKTTIRIASCQGRKRRSTLLSLDSDCFADARLLPQRNVRLQILHHLRETF